MYRWNAGSPGRQARGHLHRYPQAAPPASQGTSLQAGGSSNSVIQVNLQDSVVGHLVRDTEVVTVLILSRKMVTH